MVFSLRIEPGNIFDSLFDFLTSEAVKLLVMGLKLSVVLENILFLFGFFTGIEDNNSACVVTDGK